MISKRDNALHNSILSPVPCPSSPLSGYTLLILMFVVFAMSIALLAVTPLWQTQVQRELEEELIFRGNQYVEAIRLYQAKYPGRYPSSLEKLEEEKCLRRLYPDPVSKARRWNIILRPKDLTGTGQSVLTKVTVAPEKALKSIDEPSIIGVVSSSPKRSIKIFNGQGTYDRWLFFLGKDPEKLPEIVYFSQEREK